jgi:hypothetical protein
VIGGRRPSAAEGRFLASLLLGYYQSRELLYAGKVGTGVRIRRVPQPRRGAEQSPYQSCSYFLCSMARLLSNEPHTLFMNLVHVA